MAKVQEKRIKIKFNRFPLKQSSQNQLYFSDQTAKVLMEKNPTNCSSRKMGNLD